MFVRKKLNKGGTYSVTLVRGTRVPGKKHPVPLIVKQFGCSSDPIIVDKLVQQANEYKIQLLSTQPKKSILRLNSGIDIDTCHSYTVGFSHVYGQFFHQVFNQLSLKPSVMKSLQELVVMRIASPASKHQN
jgi:hypothetical protein